MADDTTPKPQGNAADGAAGVTQQPEGKEPPAGKKFSDEETAALLKENMAFKKKLKALEEKQAADEEGKLKEQGKFKEIAEKNEAKAKQLTERLKATAVRAAVPDILDPELIKLIDLSSVEIDEDGNVSGIDEAVAAFRQAKPHFFKASESGATVPKTPIPSRVTGKAAGYATLEDWQKAPDDDRLAWAAKNPEAFRSLCEQSTAKITRRF